MTHYGPVRWTRDDEDAYQAEQAHTEHTDGRAPDPGACLCDVADAPTHEDYRETDCPECRHDHTADGRYIEGTFVRVARKGHTCRQCLKPIGTGTRYAEYVGESSPYTSGSRYHIGACADYQLGATDAIAQCGREAAQQ